MIDPKHQIDRTKIKVPIKINIPTCNIPTCDELARGCRGLCTNHYTTANNLIRQGKVTKERLVELGIFKESKTRGGRSTWAKDILDLLN